MITHIVIAAAATASLEVAGAGSPTAAADPGVVSARPIKAAPAVRRNTLVRIRYQKGALSIDSEARALAAGNVGERIMFMNTGSHSTFSAIISGENEAVVK